MLLKFWLELPTVVVMLEMVNSVYLVPSIYSV